MEVFRTSPKLYFFPCGASSEKETAIFHVSINNKFNKIKIFLNTYNKLKSVIFIEKRRTIKALSKKNHSFFTRYTHAIIRKFVNKVLPTENGPFSVPLLWSPLVYSPCVNLSIWYRDFIHKIEVRIFS